MARPLDFFSSLRASVLLNPKWPQNFRESWTQILERQNLIDHIWLMSSGTESARHGQRKFVALSRHALESAARGVIEEFGLTAQDRALNALPLFHVGGLSVHLRAQLCQAEVVSLDDFQWSAPDFVKILRREEIKICSLVPTQLFDLVQKGLEAPSCLRWVFVGAGPLSMELAQSALQLGWPIVATYGMTETCAMVAVRSPQAATYRSLPQVHQWRHDEDQRLWFRGPALLTGYLWIDNQGQFEFTDPKIDGWFRSDDCGEIINDELRLRGRESELVKIKGESVSMLEVNQAWQEHLRADGALGSSVVISRPHARDGFELIVASENVLAAELFEAFNHQQLPFLRLNEAYHLSPLPRTELGKLQPQAVLEALSAETNYWRREAY